jgi:hypothetical protein
LSWNRADGGSAEIFADDLSTGCTAVVRGITPDLLRFLFYMLGAADWVMLPAMEGNPAITSSSVDIEGLSEGFTRIVCGSPDELGVILDEGIEAWKRYRDQVVERD